MPVLVVNQKDKRNRKIDFEADEITIGRYKTNDVVLQDSSISRFHAIIVRDEDGKFLLKDLGNKNRTLLNGKRISRMALEFGDEIRIGKYTLTLEEGKAGKRSKRVDIIKEVGTDVGETTTIIQRSTLTGSSISPGTPSLSSADPAESHERLLRIISLGRAINSVIDLDDLLERIGETAVKALAADRGFVALMDAETGKLTSEVIMDQTTKDGDGRIKVGSLIIDRVLGLSKCILIPDLKTDVKYSLLLGNEALKVSSVLCVPISVEKGPVGLIYLERVDKGRSFIVDDVDFLSMLASFAAVAIENAKHHRETCRKCEKLEQMAVGSKRMVGKSRKMQKIYEEIEKIAATDVTVLIHGENGTGKELVAEAIHRKSGRVEKAFIAVNCAAITENLMESELFGHVKGAFTDAIHDKKGFFERADGGTIFLDEISELKPMMQAKLLRVLQEMTFEKVGGEKTVHVDVRVLATTNRNLKKLIADGGFREDLFYRLSVIPVEIPPLRDRHEDIPLLANHFLDLYTLQFGREPMRISHKAMEVLLGYSWPGNIRQLDSVIQRALTLGGGDVVLPEDLPVEVRENVHSVEQYFPTMAQVERDHIIRALKHAGGNVSKASSFLKFHRGTLYNKCEDYGITPGEYKVAKEDNLS